MIEKPNLVVEIITPKKTLVVGREGIQRIELKQGWFGYWKLNVYVRQHFHTTVCDVHRFRIRNGDYAKNTYEKLMRDLGRIDNENSID